MSKIIITICTIIVMFMVLPVQSQGPEPSPTDEQIHALKCRLTEVYERIEDLKRQAKDNPSKELIKEIESLSKEASKLEGKMANFSKKQPQFGEEPEHGDFKHAPKQERMDPGKWKHNIGELERHIQQKREELEGIEAKLLETEEQGWEELEHRRAVVVKELEKLERTLHKMRQHKPSPEHGKWRQPGPEDKPQRDKASHRPKELPEDIKKQLENEFPERFQELMKLKENHPEKFHREMPRIFNEIRKLQDLKQRDPALYQIVREEQKLEYSTRDLVSKIRNAKGEEREKIKGELKGVLNQVFEVRLKMRERELEKFKEKMEKMQQDIQKRRGNRDVIVDQRIEELLGEGAQWEW